MPPPRVRDGGHGSDPWHDGDLARQIRRAALSVPANLAKGRRRTGRDRGYHWRIAAGSAEEVLGAMLYRMTH